MAEVQYISTNTIQLTKHHPMRIELTPWDLQLLLIPSIQLGQFFLKPKSTHTIVDHLKNSLSRTLEFFPPLVGRLGIAKTSDDNTSSFFIDCNNAGALFVHAVANNVTIGDVLEPEYVPRILRSFFLMNGTYNHEGISQPLLAVQVTELVDGFVIGCTINHVVTDATAYWHFLHCWSQFSRGFTDNLQPPILKRWFPSDIEFPIHIPISSTQLEDKFVFPRLEERVFHFPKEKIATLKAKANAEMRTTRISSLQALLAHLWRGVVRCRGTNANQEVKYILVINTRPRLQPPLQKTYFGSAIICETIATTAGELLNRGLGWVAWQMNKVVARQTDDGIRNFLKDWVNNPKLLSFCTNDIITNNSPLFDILGIDFGWGKTVAVRSGSTHKTDGSIMIYRGVEEGSIDISICLLPENLHTLGKDEEFMDAVTHQDMKLLLANSVAARRSSI